MEIILFTVESGRKSQQLQLIQVGLISSNRERRGELTEERVACSPDTP